MNKVLLISVVYIFLIKLDLYAQSVWDIDYIFIDSLNESHINKDIKIDFVGSEEKILKNKHPVSFLSREDSSFVTLCGGDSILFVERRNVHVDWVKYSEQQLEGLGYLENTKLITTKCLIKEISHNIIYVTMYVDFIYKKRKKEIHIGNKKLSVSIPKNKIRGFMIKKK